MRSAVTVFSLLALNLSINAQNTDEIQQLKIKAEKGDAKAQCNLG